MPQNPHEPWKPPAQGAAKKPKRPDASNKAPVGRPSDYSQKLAQDICRRIADGESLRQICASQGMPTKTSVMRWLGANVAFRDIYSRARELQAEHFAEEILAISDDGSKDSDPENVSRSRLRVETRKWLMVRMAPKKYGDKVTSELVGDVHNPLQSRHEVTVEFVSANAGKPAD
jgi:hypothetical protein